MHRHNHTTITLTTHPHIKGKSTSEYPRYITSAKRRILLAETDSDERKLHHHNLIRDEEIKAGNSSLTFAAPGSAPASVPPAQEEKCVEKDKERIGRLTLLPVRSESPTALLLLQSFLDLHSSCIGCSRPTCHCPRTNTTPTAAHRYRMLTRPYSTYEAVFLPAALQEEVTETVAAYVPPEGYVKFQKWRGAMYVI